MTARNNENKKLDTALKYAKFEALPGLVVQLLSVLSKPDTKEALPLIKKKIKDFAD